MSPTTGKIRLQSRRQIIFAVNQRNVDQCPLPYWVCVPWLCHVRVEPEDVTRRGVTEGIVLGVER